MPNTINTLKNAPGVIAKLTAGMLEDKVQFAKSIDKADDSDYNGKNGYQAGDTIYISKPARFTVGTNADITSAIQDVNEEKVALTLNQRKVIGIALTSSEIATDMALANWTKRILEPAVSRLAQEIEKDYLTAATQATYNLVGSAGSTVFDTDTVLAAGQKIDEFACPDLDNRFVLLNPAATRSAVNTRKGLFQSSEEISKQYKSGAMGMADGFAFLRNNLLYTHTNGNDVTGVAVEASVLAPATGATQLGVDGLTTTTGTVRKGQVFTIAGVNAVHPITKADLGYLQQFVVTADATADGSGNATLSISPTIYSSASGALQNVSALPADEAAIVFIGAASSSHVQSLAYHKSAFRHVSVPLVLPGGLDMAGQATSDGGFTVRVTRDYDVLTDRLIMRLDYLGGIAAVRPEWACRITA